MELTSVMTVGSKSPPGGAERPTTVGTLEPATVFVVLTGSRDLVGRLTVIPTEILLITLLAKFHRPLSLHTGLQKALEGFRLS